MVSEGFPNVTTSGRQYNIGEKPSIILYTLFGDVPISEYHFRYSLCVWRVRRTLFPLGWCFFNLVATGWISDISLCENSINQGPKPFPLYTVLLHSINVRFRVYPYGDHKCKCNSMMVGLYPMYTVLLHSIDVRFRVYPYGDNKCKCNSMTVGLYSMYIVLPHSINVRFRVYPYGDNKCKCNSMMVGLYTRCTQFFSIRSM